MKFQSIAAVILGLLGSGVLDLGLESISFG
jgi:hypothetical protein